MKEIVKRRCVDEELSMVGFHIVFLLLVSHSLTPFHTLVNTLLQGLSHIKIKRKPKKDQEEGKRVFKKRE